MIMFILFKKVWNGNKKITDFFFLFGELTV